MTEDQDKLSPSDGAHSTSDDSPAVNANTDQPAQRRGPPPNPLYHPLFLPVLLVGFSLWFFWDGFMTSDPEMAKHQLFNRISFGVSALICLRVVPRGIREFNEDREAAVKRQ